MVYNAIVQRHAIGTEYALPDNSLYSAFVKLRGVSDVGQPSNFMMAAALTTLSFSKLYSIKDVVGVGTVVVIGYRRRLWLKFAHSPSWSLSGGVSGCLACHTAKPVSSKLSTRGVAGTPSKRALRRLVHGVLLAGNW